MTPRPPRHITHEIATIDYRPSPSTCKRPQKGLSRSLREVSEIAGLRSPPLALCYIIIIIITCFLRHSASLFALILLCDLLLFLCSSSLSHPSRTVYLYYPPPITGTFFLVSLLSSLAPNEAVSRRSYCYPTCLTEWLTDCRVFSTFTGALVFPCILKPQRSSTSSQHDTSPNHLKPFLSSFIYTFLIQRPYAVYCYRRLPQLLSLPRCGMRPCYFRF